MRGTRRRGLLLDRWSSAGRLTFEPGAELAFVSTDGSTLGSEKKSRMPCEGTSRAPGGGDASGWRHSDGIALAGPASVSSGLRSDTAARWARLKTEFIAFGLLMLS